MKRILETILGVILLFGILLGLFVVVTIPFEMVQKAQAEHWPSRKGVVTKAVMNHQRGSAGRHGSASYWRPEVCGTYNDNGERFCVTRIRYGGFRFGEGKAYAAATLAKYPVGREIDIYYDPDDPRQTILEAKSPWTEMLTLLGIGLGFLVLPVLLYLFRKQIDPQRYAD